MIARVSKRQGATECAGSLVHFEIILISIALVCFASSIGRSPLCIVIGDQLGCKVNEEEKKLKRKNKNQGASLVEE